MGGRKTTTDGLKQVDRVLQIGMAALGAVLLLGSLAVVVENALGPQRPALVEVMETERTVVGDRTQVRIEAINRGDITAATVTIEGKLSTDQTATTTLDYVPGHSRKSATLSFPGNLGTIPLTLEATGWVDP